MDNTFSYKSTFEWKCLLRNNSQFKAPVYQTEDYRDFLARDPQLSLLSKFTMTT